MRALVLHGGIILALFLLQFILPEYHHTNVARIMVYAVLAIGYNLLLGYTGLMSLGHAMFFAAGAYGAGLSAHWLGFGAVPALLTGVAAGIIVSVLAGAFLLRSTGVSFLIVTLMLAQAFFLSTLYFNTYTMGEQGMVISGGQALFGDATAKYNFALAAFSACLLGTLWMVQSPIGRVFAAIRENEPRTRMLGYNTFAYRYLAIVISGSIAGLSGALYCLMFSYLGSSFASLQYSTLPLLWSLLGGTGTIIGPLVGTGLMYYLIDIASDYTSSYLLLAGVALLVLTLWFPKGIMGAVRERLAPWLP